MYWIFLGIISYINLFLWINQTNYQYLWYKCLFFNYSSFSNSSGLTEENMVKFNINNSMPENGYHNKSHRSSSICSNRTGRSVRTNFSNCSRNSQRYYINILIFQINFNKTDVFFFSKKRQFLNWFLDWLINVLLLLSLF